LGLSRFSDAGTIMSRQSALSFHLRNRASSDHARRAPSTHAGPASSDVKRPDLVDVRRLDAGLSDAHEVPPAMLRPNLRAFLLQAGSPLCGHRRIVGRLPQEDLPPI